MDERTITQLRLENRNQAEHIKALKADVKKHHDVMVEIRKERDNYRALLIGLHEGLDMMREDHHGWLIKRGESCNNLRDIEKLLERYNPTRT